MHFGALKKYLVHFWHPVFENKIKKLIGLKISNQILKIFREINWPKCDSRKQRLQRPKARAGTEKRGRKLGLALMQKYVSYYGSEKILESYLSSYDFTK